jgi:hypothetical protein
MKITPKTSLCKQSVDSFGITILKTYHSLYIKDAILLYICALLIEIKIMNYCNLFFKDIKLNKYPLSSEDAENQISIIIMNYGYKPSKRLASH